MPKKAVQVNLIKGYSPWAKRYTINQAKNVARWNPWLAHEWMDEAARGLSIDQAIDFAKLYPTTKLPTKPGPSVVATESISEICKFALFKDE